MPVRSLVFPLLLSLAIPLKPVVGNGHYGTGLLTPCTRVSAPLIALVESKLILCSASELSLSPEMFYQLSL